VTHYAQVLEGVCPAYGWQGGPLGDVEIQTQKNQHERRNDSGIGIRHQYSLPFANITKQDYLLYLKRAFMAVGTTRDSFLVEDWLDHEADMASLGVAPAGSAAVQLVLPYGWGEALETRLITKPNLGGIDQDGNTSTFTVYQADGSGNPVEKEVTADPETGLIVPTGAWTAGRALWWSGFFYVPVRFNNAYMPFSIDARSGAQHIVNGGVELIEVFGE